MPTHLDNFFEPVTRPLVKQRGFHSSEINIKVKKCCCNVISKLWRYFGTHRVWYVACIYKGIQSQPSQVVLLALGLCKHEHFWSYLKGISETILNKEIVNFSQKETT